jgi:hypothetical protein
VVMGRRPPRLPGAAKRASDRPSRSGDPDFPPPVLWPLVQRVPKDDFRFTDDQISELEKAGGVTFSEGQRRSLQTLAHFWHSDLRQRRSHRPGAFRKRLDKMSNALTQALKAIRLNVLSATELDRHLLHWVMEAPIQGAFGFLGALESQIEEALKTVAALKDCLPKDPGKPRPYDDERRLKSLADIFEDAGGAARVYIDSHKGKIVDTPFRRFAQEFYRLLPAGGKRKPSGLDEALRAVLTERRRPQTSS